MTKTMKKCLAPDPKNSHRKCVRRPCHTGNHVCGHYLWPNVLAPEPTKLPDPPRGRKLLEELIREYINPANLISLVIHKPLDSDVYKIVVVERTVRKLEVK
jgi:hypothetical protein